MDRIVLISPTEEYSEEIMAYRQEFLDAGDSMDGCGNLRHCSTAKEWLETLRLYADPNTCPEGKVPSTSYIAVRPSDGRIVGVIDLRHHIDHPVLSLWGGHIGYSVRPSERRKGYATEMLRQQLINAKELGLTRVMVTCDRYNIASERTIIANGGVFEREVAVEDDSRHEYVKRYWIKL